MAICSIVGGDDERSRCLNDDGMFLSSGVEYIPLLETFGCRFFMVTPWETASDRFTEVMNLDAVFWCGVRNDDDPVTNSPS